MVNISLNFGTFFNFIIFLVLFALCSLWSYYCIKKEKKYVLAPVIIVSVLFLIIWGMLAGIDVDEVEHLHCSWMVYSGYIPFRDFWQHHSPLLWVLLAPVFAALKPSAWIIDFSRILSGAMFGLIIFFGWRLSRKVWRDQANLSMYLLIVFSASIIGEFLCLRPDLLTTLFLLIFLDLCLEIPSGKTSIVFFSGAAFGLAASFLFKQYLLFFLPLYIILSKMSRPRGIKIIVYLLGICFGALPLIYYLLGNNIVREFIFWVFSYNRKRMVLSADFPIAVGLVGVWGAGLLLKRYYSFKDNKALILLAAFFLSTLSSLTHMLRNFYSYNIGFWFMLCAVAGSGLDLKIMTNRTHSLLLRSLLVGLFLSLLLSLNVVNLSTHKESYFNGDKKAISALIKYSAHDTCLAILPYHPIFAYDASRLYSFWQFHLSGNYPEIKSEIISRGLAEEVRRSKPAVVLSIFNGRDFLRELFHKSLISQNDVYSLRDFFREGYTMKIIGKNAYFIRNDKL